VAQRFGQVGTELGTPDPDRLMTDLDTSLEQQLLHIPVQKQKAVIEIDRVGDDGLGKAVTLGPFMRLEHRASLTHLK
jgi:RNA binding exosome subunit